MVASRILDKLIGYETLFARWKPELFKFKVPRVYLSVKSKTSVFATDGICVTFHPIRVVEEGNYHVIVCNVYSGVQHPMISMLFIP